MTHRKKFDDCFVTQRLSKRGIRLELTYDYHESFVHGHVCRIRITYHFIIIGDRYYYKNIILNVDLPKLMQNVS